MDDSKYDVSMTKPETKFQNIIIQHQPEVEYCISGKCWICTVVHTCQSALCKLFNSIFLCKYKVVYICMTDAHHNLVEIKIYKLVQQWAKVTGTFF